jgi:hypothetical protein
MRRWLLVASAEGGGDLLVPLAVPPSAVTGPIEERGADGPLKSLGGCQALVEEQGGPELKIGCKVGVVAASENSSQRRWMTFSRSTPTDSGGMMYSPTLIF